MCLLQNSWRLQQKLQRRRMRGRRSLLNFPRIGMGLQMRTRRWLRFWRGTRRAALKLVLQPVLGDETQFYEWRSTAFLQRMLTERPAGWLPATYKNYDELLRSEE